MDQYRICLVTDELMDIAPSGGIGTATQYLAKALIKKGFLVKILFSNPVVSESNCSEIKKHFLLHHDMDVDFLNIQKYEKWNPFYLQRAKAVYDYFFCGSGCYDVVLFHELWHDGYLCLKCKSTMPCFNNTKLGVICHSSLQWIQESHNLDISDGFFVHSDLERECVALADFLISPSKYMINWMESRGWLLPNQVYILPHAMEPDDGWPEELPSLSNPISILNEIVFFGRIEPRKGIYTFIEALKLIPPDFLSDKCITFLGRQVIPKSDVMKQIEAMNLPVREYKWLYFEDYNISRAYIRQQGKLVVMPSPADNSPCVIYECLIDKIAFICSNNGGQSELIDPIDHEYCLFDPNPKSLAGKIIEIINSGVFRIPQPSKDVKNASLLNFSTFLKEADEAKKIIPLINAPQNPFISIIVLVTDQSNFFPSFLRSIAEQEYQKYELLFLVDYKDNQKLKGEIITKMEETDKRFQLIQTNRYSITKSFKSAIINATGDYLVFVPDQISLYPQYLSKCLNVLEKDDSNCVLTGLKDNTNDFTSFWLPAGGGHQNGFMLSSIFENLYGDKCIFIERKICSSVFFQEPYISGFSEWAFLLDVQLSGNRISVQPEPLYKINQGNVVQTPSEYREFLLLKRILEKHHKFHAAFLSELYLFKKNEPLSKLHHIMKKFSPFYPVIRFLCNNTHSNIIFIKLLRLVNK